MSKKTSRAAILYGKPPSLSNRPKRRKRWQEAKNEHRLMCKRLSKGTPQQQEMAERSAGCKRIRPCHQAWCPQCQFRAQERIIDECAPKLRVLLREAQEEAKKAGKPIPKAWAVSAVDESMAVKRGKLDPREAKCKGYILMKRIEYSSLSETICFLGWDVSLNTKKGRKPQWQPHVYGFVFAATKEAIHKVFDPVFGKPKAKWHKPVKVYDRSPEDIWKTARYVLKPNIVRREMYLNSKGKWRPKKRALKANEKVEVSMFLEELGFQKRLLLQGVKIVRGTLVKTTLLRHQKRLKAREEAFKRLLGGSGGLFQ